MDLLAPSAFPSAEVRKRSASSTAPPTPVLAAALDPERRCLLDASFLKSLAEPSATLCVNDESLTTKSLSTWESFT
ncbi:hypothetical protein FMUND_11436 [Fusarium mundagurra]|uniref:Uncharacterized protein n=1 Tax=Fusarium mundagurra TaxID=1567541 RepID=A0A8H5Y669_9HYPO|nr:hypothetical protein FMUND_11436 [Fusarium mundagurra]